MIFIKEVNIKVVVEKVKVSINNNQSLIKIPSGVRMLIRQCCCAVLKHDNINKNVEISIVFVDNETIKELNLKHRNKHNVTDVLSFPLSDDLDNCFINPETNLYMLGDIVISIEKAYEQAKEYSHSIKREIAYLTVHSMLHLLGYDHENSQEEYKLMRIKEEHILNSLGASRAE